jgi:hypothetical protein
MVCGGSKLQSRFQCLCTSPGFDVVEVLLCAIIVIHVSAGRCRGIARDYVQNMGKSEENQGQNLRGPKFALPGGVT